MRNVEWKARLLYRERAERICRELGAREVAILEQRDTYFRVARGRLKRRECAGRPTEWIEYFRPDQRDARSSDYALYTSREAVERFDLDALEVLVVVAKRRALFLKGEVRIHLDDVEGLGSFFELEALVNERQSQAEAERALEALCSAFKPALGEPLALSYSDLMLERG